MGQYFLKFTLVCLLTNIVCACLAQSIILRPSLGVRFFNTKQDNSFSNNTDPTFNRAKAFDERTANVALELLNKKSSIEIIFTSQASGDYMSSYFKATNDPNEGVYVYVGGNGGITQLQLTYNRFFTIKKKFFANKTPFVGLGFGFGINRPPSFFANESFRFYNATSLNGASTIKVEQFSTPLNRFSYSTPLKIGVAFKKKNVERFRAAFVYNIGLNILNRHDVLYSHNNTKYNSVATTRASQRSILFSMPIYLKRKR